MNVWKQPINLDELQARSSNTMAEFCGIKFTSYTHDSLTATMPVMPQTKQPIGILHGGASCVLAETVGSTAANYCIDQTAFFCVGLDINVSHIKQVKFGLVTATASALHIGRTTQVWAIRLFNDERVLTAYSRLTMAVLARKSSE